MWSGFDPEIQRDLNAIRQMVSHLFQTPVKEWPLTFVEEFETLFVIREWPDGSITAYGASRDRQE